MYPTWVRACENFQIANGEDSYLVHQRRHNDFPDIGPERSFEFQTSFGVKQQVLCQASPVLAETLIERVVPHCLEPVPDRREEVVEIVPVLVVVEMTSRFFKFVAGFVALRFENVAGLKQDLYL
jgi:hypothetical protein